MTIISDEKGLLSNWNSSPFSFYEKVLKVLYHTRFADIKMGKLVRQNKGGTFHLSVQGHELIGAVTSLLLTSGKDFALPYYRDRAFAIGLGASLTHLFASFLARDIQEHSGGRMMPEHFSDLSLRIPCQSSCVGSQFLQAVGVAKACLLNKTDEVVYVSGGDGSTSQGDFHEALNFSAIHKLPIIFVIQDNGWAISVTTAEQTAGGSAAGFGKGYQGLSLFEIDGTDVTCIVEAFGQALQKARSGDGPTLIVAHVPRLGAHSISDDPKKYQTEEDAAAAFLKDPIPIFEKFLLDQEVMSISEIESIKQTCFEEVEKAALYADAIPTPLPHTATHHVFKEAPPIIASNDVPSGDPIVIMDALNHALIEEMERDEKVVVFGQDVAKGKGGVFGITRGLTARFGEERCFNTPLAESTIVGLAIGLSLNGFKPVAEIQFIDYSWTAMNQIVNELASLHYRSNGIWHCPVVLRMPYGGYIQGGPYHSQSIEALFCHTPGLKVVIPSNASDAKRLLKTAIRDPNPVIFLEHKAIYRQRLFCAQSEPASDSLLPFGVANIVREGDDLTIISYGMMVGLAVEVTDQLLKEGISSEVIDLRTLVPLDSETIFQSVRKTGKLLILHEAPKNCGFGAELAAMVSENLFFSLDAPIVRVTGKDCPVPYCKILEEEVLPQKSELEKKIRDLAAF